MNGFYKALKRGHAYEEIQDELYSARFTIERATLDQDRFEGIDRWFTPTEYVGERFSVQYKADERCATTGNVFIELEANTATGDPGWAVKPPGETADYLSIFVPSFQEAYFMSTRLLRAMVPVWYVRWPVRETRGQLNDDQYTTKGVVVPIQQVEQLAGVSTVRAAK